MITAGQYHRLRTICSVPRFSFSKCSSTTSSEDSSEEALANRLLETEVARSRGSDVWSHLETDLSPQVPVDMPVPS